MEKVSSLSLPPSPPLPSRVVEAARRVAEGRKLHSGYQFVLTEDIQMAERMVKHSLEGQLPLLFIWEPRTGLHYPYTVRTPAIKMTGDSLHVLIW